jgi:hypothetical protein
MTPDGAREHRLLTTQAVSTHDIRLLGIFDLRKASEKPERQPDCLAVSREGDVGGRVLQGQAPLANSCFCPWTRGSWLVSVIRIAECWS